MPDAIANTTPVQRRRLLRTGVVMAGVAAGAVAATAGVTGKAEAATGGNVVLGAANSADLTTTIAADPTTDVRSAALGLSHGNNGPTLFLDPEPAGWVGDLELGDIINTEEGPFIGTRMDGIPTTDYLATGYDLAVQPILYTVGPTRLLDTRSDRSKVIGRSSTNPFDEAFRLKAREWIDVAVEPADEEYTAEAGFFNLTVTGSLAGGNLTAYPPGDRPAASTLNFQKGLSLANATFVALGVVGRFFAVRIYTSATAHVIVDYTGVSVTQFPGPLAPAAARTQGATRRRSRSSRRIQSKLGRITR